MTPRLEGGRARTECPSARTFHDLRSPVAVALGYAELLESGAMGDLTREQRDALGALQRSLQDVLASLTRGEGACAPARSRCDRAPRAAEG